MSLAISWRTFKTHPSAVRTNEPECSAIFSAVDALVLTEIKKSFHLKWKSIFWVFVQENRIGPPPAGPTLMPASLFSIGRSARLSSLHRRGARRCRP